MPALRDFLARFRPAGPPGAAARAGVPADRSGELAAEVGPVLALLESTDAERERIIAQARRDAGQITAAARAEEAAIAADAGRRARAARAEAARQAMALARDEAARAVRFNLKVIEVRAPEDDSGIRWRGHQTQVAFDRGMEADPGSFNRVLNRGLIRHQ